MFRFTQEKIMPLFLQRRMTVAELARKAKVNHKTTEKAVKGLPVTSKVVDKIATALEIDAMQFLEKPQTSASV